MTDLKVPVAKHGHSGVSLKVSGIRLAIAAPGRTIADSASPARPAALIL